MLKSMRGEEHLHIIVDNPYKAQHTPSKAMTFLDTVNNTIEVNYEMVSLPHEEFIVAAPFMGAPK